jgi:hypothetical protein
MNDGLRRTKLDNQGRHFYEHTTVEGILPWREWIRDALPTGSDGFTFEDIDGLAAVHGNLARSGSKFMLLEIKWWGTKLDYSQKFNFERVHRLLRKADPFKREYAGFYILEWPRERGPYVRLNYRHLLEWDQLEKFLLFRLRYPSYFSPE